jgi:hypothetical protein
VVPTLPRIVIDTNVLLGLWIFSEPSLSSLRAALDDGTVTAVRRSGLQIIVPECWVIDPQLLVTLQGKPPLTPAFSR